jgi:two-component system sensor histidine kinase KdpD
MSDLQNHLQTLFAEVRRMSRDTGGTRKTFAMPALRGWPTSSCLQLYLVPPYSLSLGLASAALAVALGINWAVAGATVSGIFLIAVLVSSTFHGLWPAMLTASISAVFYDLFFLPPLYSLAVHSTVDLINLISFAVTAVVVSGLAARVREQAILAGKRAAASEQLSTFSRHIGDALTVNEVLESASEEIATAMGASALVLLTGDAGLHPTIAQCGDIELGSDDLEILRQEWITRLTLGNPAEPFQLHGWHFRGCSSFDETHCLVGIRPDGANPGIEADQDHFLMAFAQQTASAITHNRLRQRLDDARVRARTEEFHATLLDSVSHDLRGPLTSVLGASSALQQHWRTLSDASRVQLIAIAREGAEVLDDYISNLLDITRIESGAMGPRLAPVALDDLIGEAAHKVRSALARHRLGIALPGGLPRVEADAALLQQAIMNVLDNAAKYSPEGSLVSVIAEQGQNFVELTIMDEGPGLPEEDIDRIFEKFFRSSAVQRRVRGTGLGLAICRGIIEAMNGSITAANRTDRPGLSVTISLPASLQLTGVE